MIKLRKNAPEGKTFIPGFLDSSVGGLLPFRRVDGVVAYKLLAYKIEQDGKSVLLTLEDSETWVREEMRSFRNAD